MHHPVAKEEMVSEKKSCFTSPLIPSDCSVSFAFFYLALLKLITLTIKLMRQNNFELKLSNSGWVATISSSQQRISHFQRRIYGSIYSTFDALL